MTSLLTNDSERAQRKPDYPIEEIFLNRWSPRAMNGEPIPQPLLMTLFEAARWAPSSYNNQPWRFIYALGGTPEWKTLFSLVAEPNAVWAQASGALVVIVSKKTFDSSGKPSRTHSFDAGAAWMSFALQGSVLGLAVHGMEGFDYDKARTILHIPEDYQIEAMAAIGRRGQKDELPQAMQDRESPTPRKPLKDFVFEGTFPS